jgi:hypothetical protein
MEEYISDAGFIEDTMKYLANCDDSIEQVNGFYNRSLERTTTVMTNQALLYERMILNGYILSR